MARLTKKKMIKNAQEELLAIFDSIKDPICIVDKNYSIKRLNMAMSELIGLEIKEALGKECYKYLFGKRKKCESCYFETDRADRLPYKRISKTIKGVEMVFELTIYSYQNGDSECAIFHFKDITNKVNIEKNLSKLNDLYKIREGEKDRELKRTRTKFEKILKHSPLGIAIIDDKRSFITANSAFGEILGFDVELLSGKPLLSITSKKNKKHYHTFLGELEKSGVYSTTINTKTQSGLDLNLFVIGFLLGGGYGESQDIALMIQDITKKEILTKELVARESIAAAGRMTASLAAEIKKPLLGIKNSLVILKEKLEEEGEKRKIIEKVIDELMGLQQFLEKIRLFFLTKKEKRKFVDLNEIIREFIYIVGSRLRENNIVVKMSLSKKLPQVSVCPENVSQAMLHLINNAEGAMNKGGSITVSTRKRGSVVQLVVSDQGNGIDKKTLDQIKDPSFMGDDRRVALGLYICRNIMVKHDGTLEIRSTKGEGTKVVLNFPLSSKVDKELLE